SSVTKRSNQIAYCTGSGRSSPSRWRSCSLARWISASRSVLAPETPAASPPWKYICTGSPGARCMIRNAMNVTPTNVGIINRVRLIAYASMLLAVLLIRHRHPPFVHVGLTGRIPDRVVKAAVHRRDRLRHEQERVRRFVQDDLLQAPVELDAPPLV